MSQGKLCHLCVTFSQEHRCLYNEKGDENEDYELIFKYFDPECLYMGKELGRTTVCLACWRQIYGFYNFQESIYEAQKDLLDSSKHIDVLEIGSPEKGKGNELMENPDINIKNEQEFLSEDECVSNSENNFDSAEVASVSANKEIYGTAEKNSTYLLPKLEIMDIYSSDDSCEDTDDNQDVSYMENDSTQKDDSLDVAPAIQHAEWKPRYHCNVEMDQLMAHADFADQAKVCLQCIVCLENAPTYSLLRQHFKSEHPQERFYLLCCKQKLYQRYRIKNHVRLHIDPNAFKCALCHKKLKDDKTLLLHNRIVHEAKKASSKKAKTVGSKKGEETDKKADDLIAQWISNLECLVCKQVYNRLTLLKNHFRKNHPQEQFRIECCQQIFITRYEFQEHVLLHINPDAFKCKFCGSRFNRRKNFLRHMKGSHPSSGSE